MLPKLICEENVKQFLGSFDNVLTDCDGVLWNGANLIPDADNVLNGLRGLGKGIFYITNNSTKTRDTLLEKCQKLGYIANKDEVISSSYIAAQYLRNLNFKKKVYAVGSVGLASELNSAEIPHTGIGPADFPKDLYDIEKYVKLDPDVGAVIVGYDCFFNVTKVACAASYLKNPECLFIATNTDEVFPTGNDGVRIPGTGVFVRGVETAAGRKAEIMGKPLPRCFTVLKEKYGLIPERTLMIGDRCNTDILFGKNCGLQTLVVLSGVTTWQDLIDYSESSNEEEKRLLADYYLPSLGDLNKFLS